MVKKYGRKIWDLGGTGKEETELRWLSARCRKGAWEEATDLSVWQSDGKTMWEVYNFGYADKEKRNLNTEDRSWLSEKSQVETSQWRCEDENEVPEVGERARELE